MKIEFEDEKSLWITAETQREVVELIEYLNSSRYSVLNYLAELNEGHLRAKAPIYPDQEWHGIFLTVHPKWTAPYFAFLKEITGVDGSEWDIPVVPWNDYGFKLCHTHLVKVSWIKNGVFKAEGYIRAQSAAMASETFERYVTEFLGAPGLCSKALWVALYQHWEANYASKAQKELLQLGKDLDPIFHQRPLLSRYAPGFYIERYTKIITYQQLKEAA